MIYKVHNYSCVRSLHGCNNVTSNECIADTGKILEISDTSEYIKGWYKGSVSLRYIFQGVTFLIR